METQRKIPSEEDFARAKANMRRDLERAAQIRKQFLATLPASIPSHDVLVWVLNPTPTLSFIFPTDALLEFSAKNGQRDTIDKIAASAFAEVGCPQYLVEYHSQEVIQKKCNGDYRKYFG